MSTMRLLKLVTSLLPKSAHRMGHRPPLDFYRWWSSSLNVLLWRLVRSFAGNLQPLNMCVFVSGDWNLMHMRDGLCFLLHLWMCTPHATSNESLLAQKYAWIVWSEPLVLASFRICPYIVVWRVML